MVAHRWLHVGEEGWGVGLVNESTYGHAVRRSTSAQGEPVTTMRLTLLRSPCFPDPMTDSSEVVGEHVLRFGIVAGANVEQTIEHAYAAHLPLVEGPGAVGRPVDAQEVAGPLIEVDGGGAIVEAVKLAEDGSGDVVVRLYESLGGRQEVTLRPRFPIARAVETDLLENADSVVLEGRRALGEGWAHDTHPGRADTARLPSGIRLRLRPFQIVTLRLTPS